MRKIQKKKVMLVVIVIIAMLMLVELSWGAPKKDGEWKRFKGGTVIDLDPIWSGGNLFLMIHLDSQRWSLLNVNSPDWEGDRPSIGNHGYLYYKDNKDKDGCIYKWVNNNHWSKTKSKPNLKLKPVISKPKVITPSISVSWKDVFRELPDAGKAVVIKFSDGRTATAFITYDNGKKEWKLHMNKNKYRGGITVKNVVKWKDVGAL